MPTCSALVKPPLCQGVMFPSAVWKDEAGKFQMLAATFLNNASWGQKTGRYETSDKSLRRWKLVDADFAQGHGENGGAWFLPVPGEKTALFVHFLYKNDHFTKTGSGQT